MIDVHDDEYYVLDREYGVGLIIDYKLNFCSYTTDITIVCSGKVIDRKFGFHKGDIAKLESKFMSKEAAQEKYPEWFV